jgi:hypothetical protein
MRLSVMSAMLGLGWLGVSCYVHGSKPASESSLPFEGPRLSSTRREEHPTNGVSDDANLSKRANPTEAAALLLAPASTFTVSVTLVTQLDATRLDYLAQAAVRWRAPLIAAVLLSRDTTLGRAIGNRVFESHVTLLPHVTPVTPANASSYPINLLRNLGIQSVNTTHYIVLDVDLWPSASLHAAIMGVPNLLLRSKYAALVVPAFQLNEDQRGNRHGSADETGHANDASFANFARVPIDKAELERCLGAKQCSPFYSHTSPETHSSTPYAWWQNAAPGSEPQPIKCFRSARYEPYVVLPKLATTPTYSEAFAGYGKNKIEVITHLRFAGFRFYALPGAFVTHAPHAKSRQKAMWEAGGQRKRNDQLYKKFVAEMIERYQRPRTPSCSPGKLL